MEHVHVFNVIQNWAKRKNKRYRLWIYGIDAKGRRIILNGVLNAARIVPVVLD